MYYLNIIQESLNYIEENLTTELNVNEISQLAGFSTFHYYRLFSKAIGMPIKQYIIRRRLLNAIYEINEGSKMIDTSLKYCFDTHAGFYKAFRREFGYSPSMYIKLNLVQKPYQIRLGKEVKIMLSNKKILSILNNWPIDEPDTIEPKKYESSGRFSDNSWIINDKYILKVTTNEMQLKNSILLNNMLIKKGISSAETINTKDNKNYFKDNNLYFHLQSKSKGQVISSSSYLNNDTSGIYLGKLLVT